MGTRAPLENCRVMTIREDLTERIKYDLYLK